MSGPEDRPGDEAPPRWLPPSSDPAPQAAPQGDDLSRSYAVAEGSAPALTTASYGARAGAAGVDFVVRLAIILAASLVGSIAYTGGTEAGDLGVDIGSGVGLVIALLYAPVMMGRTGGQTVGHRATHTRIVRRDGSTLTPRRAGLREIVVKGMLFEGLAVLLVFIPTVVNYLWPLWDEDDECLHDKICETRVVEV